MAKRFSPSAAPATRPAPPPKTRSAPMLNGFIGRKAGTVEGYNYSPANKNSGLTWDEATFSEYIKDPKAKVPGTKMIYPGLKDEQRIKDLIAYLKQFDASGQKSVRAHEVSSPPRGPMSPAAARPDGPSRHMRATDDRGWPDPCPVTYGISLSWDDAGVGPCSPRRAEPCGEPSPVEV